MEVDEERTAAEVERLMGFAKLDATEMNTCVQCLYFKSNLNNDQYKLLEVDKETLKTLQIGQKLVIRGSATDSAVLCTSSNTFELKEAETSNTMLLLSKCYLGDDLKHKDALHTHQHLVSSIHKKYFELRPILPRLRRLRKLLEENQFSGYKCEDDEDHQGQKYSMEDLLDAVQASQQEIEDHLKDFGACMIDGKWRLLEFDYKAQVLEHLIRIMEENEGEKLKTAHCQQVLENIYPCNIVEHVLRMFGKTADPSGDVFDMDEDQICQCFAEMILRKSARFNLSEFFRVWQQSVPSVFRTGEHQLEGMALIDRDSKPESVRFFPVLDLPEDVLERFDFLFENKEKWTLDEISPYVRDLCSDKQGVAALLTKYARASTRCGIKVYSSKK